MRVVASRCQRPFVVDRPVAYQERVRLTAYTDYSFPFVSPTRPSSRLEGPTGTNLAENVGGLWVAVAIRCASPRGVSGLGMVLGVWSGNGVDGCGILAFGNSAAPFPPAHPTPNNAPQSTKSLYPPNPL